MQLFNNTRTCCIPIGIILFSDLVYIVFSLFLSSFKFGGFLLVMTLCGLPQLLIRQHYVMSALKAAYCTSVILNLFDLIV